MVGKGQIFKMDLETAEVLNTFFGNIEKNLEINQYPNSDPVINDVHNFESCSKIQRPPKHSCNSKQL